MIVCLRFLKKLPLFFILFFYSFSTFAVEDSVSLQLKWKHQFQFAGFYAAQIKGFYSQENLHVNLKEFKYSTKIEDDIIQGKSEYGVTSSNIIRDFSLGKPLVVLSTIFQHSPYVIISLKGNAISKPTDLSGKKVVVADGLGSVILQVLLNREGIPADSVKSIPYTKNLNLKDPNIDAISAYRSDKPYYLETIGLDYSVIDPSNYGVDFYGDVLFTSKDELDKHPQRAHNFLKASLKGWEYALDHPEEIAEYILGLPGVKDRGLTKEMLLNEASVIRELIRPDLVELGHINKGRWEVILQSYKNIGLIDENVTLQGFLYIPEDINLIYNKRLTIVVVVLLLAGLISLIRIYYIKRNYKIQEKKILEFTINEKFNEDNINMILEHADISMWKWDAELDEFSFFNANKGNIFSKYNINKINDFKTLIHPEFLPKFDLFITLKSHHYKEELLIKSNPQDETYNWCMLVIKVRELDNDHKPKTFMGLSIDISDMKKKQYHLDNLTKKLLKTNSELQKFAYITSHNLRAPIVNLESLLQFYDYETSDVQNHEIVEKMETSIKRLKDTLDDLVLVVSKKTEDKTFENVDIEFEIYQVLNDFQREIENANAKIEIDFSAVDKIVYNTKRFREIFAQLISNSLKFQNIQIPLKIELKSSDCIDFIAIEISDNGTGIDLDKNMSKMFGLYQRFHPEIEGKGSGLFIIKSQIESLDGKIEVKSKLNFGTTFTVFFRKRTLT